MERSDADLAQENQRLKRAVAELSILNEVASAISLMWPDMTLQG